MRAALRADRHSGGEPRDSPAADVPIDEMTDEQWRRTVAINLDSVFGLVKHSVAEMKKIAGPGCACHVVLISSTAGQRGEAYRCDYAAAKGALISMVKGLASELAPHNIYVNCVAPGWVDTDMSRPTLDDPASAKEIFDTIPIGHVGAPDQIAGPIMFLSRRWRDSSPEKYSTLMEARC